MGWFDEQIRRRKEQDNSAFEASFLNIAGAVLGERLNRALMEDRQLTSDAVGEILRYFHVHGVELPQDAEDLDDQLECLLRPHGIMRRTIRLSEGWYRNFCGAMLARKKGGGIVAMLPGRLFGYFYYDPETGKTVKINSRTAKLFEPDAICFYRPFTLEKLTIRSILGYIIQCFTPADILASSTCTVALIAGGLLVTSLTKALVDKTVAVSIQPVLATGFFLLCMSMTKAMFEAIRQILVEGISVRVDASTESAVMMRIISMPARFFHKFTPGDLNTRMQYLNQLCSALTRALLVSIINGMTIVVYIIQIAYYAPPLAVPSALILLLSFVVSVLLRLMRTYIGHSEREATAAEHSMSVAMLNGIQKIRVAGAEKRAFAKWGNLYAKEVSYTYNVDIFERAIPVVNTAIMLLGMIMVYYIAVTNHVGVSEYYAFETAFGMASGAALIFNEAGLEVAKIPSFLLSMRQLMDEEPEISDGVRIVTKLTGNIELSNVSFRYSEMMPPVINHMSVKIRPGEYVALVGPSGCGKSTLLRLLLGFEKPQRGAIYYDGRDMKGIDLKSLRSKIGVVLQGSSLFSGTVYENISISAPDLTMKDAWKVAEEADIAEEIRRMPMGMHTKVQEGSGGMSGGQRQRLLIASAIAPKPKVLMFDEATSALDNISQRKISRVLDNMKNCTKIVAAHRLSTIRNCDRILVIDQGRIVEEGNYEELIAKNGAFAELVKRQMTEL